VQLTYTKSGVNIDSGEEVVRRIKKRARSSFTKNVLADIGSFGAFYRASFPGLSDPILVSSVDGVGTKLKIAFAARRYDTIGQDLVNHCVNDIAVCGASPLFFMDYFATGKLSPVVAEKVINGFVVACRKNGCSLVGGETAEMPGFYEKGEFDIAGMIVGVVDKKKIIDGRKIRRGDVLVGLPSTGLHTNGFSLARRILLEKFSVASHIKGMKGTLGDTLLAVHRSYLEPIRRLKSRMTIHGISHITGGGIVGNTMRIIPKGLHLSIHWNTWVRPKIFSVIQELGNVPEEDMRKTFNLGIGLIFIVSRSDASTALSVLRRGRELPVLMGEVN
jgi:phosphoribosylformylglycinamidine cyclo-ligase